MLIWDLFLPIADEETGRGIMLWVDSWYVNQASRVMQKSMSRALEAETQSCALKFGLT